MGRGRGGTSSEVERSLKTIEGGREKEKKGGEGEGGTSSEAVRSLKTIEGGREKEMGSGGGGVFVWRTCVCAMCVAMSLNEVGFKAGK